MFEPLFRGFFIAAHFFTLTDIELLYTLPTSDLVVMFMHPFPQGYRKVEDGDLIQAGDLALGKVTSACGQGSYGWGNVAPHLIGQEYFEGALELGHPMMLIRKNEDN